MTKESAKKISSGIDGMASKLRLPFFQNVAYKVLQMSTAVIVSSVAYQASAGETVSSKEDRDRAGMIRNTRQLLLLDENDSTVEKQPIFYKRWMTKTFDKRMPTQDEHLFKEAIKEWFKPDAKPAIVAFTANGIIASDKINAVSGSKGQTLPMFDDANNSMMIAPKVTFQNFETSVSAPFGEREAATVNITIDFTDLSSAQKDVSSNVLQNYLIKTGSAFNGNGEENQSSTTVSENSGSLVFGQNNSPEAFPGNPTEDNRNAKETSTAEVGAQSSHVGEASTALPEDTFADSDSLNTEASVAEVSVAEVDAQASHVAETSAVFARRSFGRQEPNEHRSKRCRGCCFRDFSRIARRSFGRQEPNEHRSKRCRGCCFRDFSRIARRSFGRQGPNAH